MLRLPQLLLKPVAGKGEVAVVYDNDDKITQQHYRQQQSISDYQLCKRVQLGVSEVERYPQGVENNHRQKAGGEKPLHAVAASLWYK